MYLGGRGKKHKNVVAAEPTHNMRTFDAFHFFKYFPRRKIVLLFYLDKSAKFMSVVLK